MLRGLLHFRRRGSRCPCRKETRLKLPREALSFCWFPESKKDHSAMSASSPPLSCRGKLAPPCLSVGRCSTKCQQRKEKCKRWAVNFAPSRIRRTVMVWTFRSLPKGKFRLIFSTSLSLSFETTLSLTWSDQDKETVGLCSLKAIYIFSFINQNTKCQQRKKNVRKGRLISYL